MHGKRIAVLGDLMLDRYIWGSVTRVSPEAPVPVVDMEQEQTRLGGAANVANNIRSLGGEAVLIGAIGGDGSGDELLGLLGEVGFTPEGVIRDPSRHTTVKTRVIAHGQHVVRIDRETKTDISGTIQDAIMKVLSGAVKSLDGIIIEDYNKGVVVLPLIQRTVALANRQGTIITVDPKFNNFFEYKRVTVFKPNRKEVEEALSTRLSSEEEVLAAGRKLLKRLRARNVLLTRGDEGMSLFEEDGTVSHVPTKARTVADVSGAGDTVIATLTLAMASGATAREASALANYAGGIVCGSVGILPVEKAELRRTVLAGSSGRPGRKGT